MQNIAIIGASGAIGQAFISVLADKYPDAQIHAFSRKKTHVSAQIIAHTIDYKDEKSIAQSAEIASQKQPLDLVIVANGVLHDGDLMPEKCLKDLKSDNFHKIFDANTIVPAMIAKHFLPKLNKNNKSIFAALSARVGSISDNQLGGWYAYRASKAALNMILKNISIEVARTNKSAIIIGLHPGTVNSNLSKPFQKLVPENKLFTPEFAANKLLEVIESATPQQSGKCIAWDGEEILP